MWEEIWPIIGLAMDGHEMRLAHDGVAALDIAQTFRPQVILLDIGMPHMNGYEVARQLRSKEGSEDIKLIAVTGWGQLEDKQRAIDAGFDGHLVKPLDVAELRELL